MASAWRGQYDTWTKAMKPTYWSSADSCRTAPVSCPLSWSRTPTFQITQHGDWPLTDSEYGEAIDSPERRLDTLGREFHEDGDNV